MTQPRPNDRRRRRRLQTITTLAATACAAAATVLTGPGVAAAATVRPFHIQPASFGNPNGSFDVPPIHCGTASSLRGGVTVTGTLADGWGCLPGAHVSWLNLATGATGAARMSGGLGGRPAQARLRTGPGQVVVMVTASGVITPGFATVAVW